jgi:hypothetical protein
MKPLAAEWRQISDGYLGSVFLDFDTIKNKKDTITVWQLQNFSQEDLHGVKSRRLLIEINCLKNSRRVVYLTAHSEQMGEGTVKFVSAKIGEWEQPLPKSLGEKVFITVCERKKVY